ncbi:MAG: tRNA epoxyqueuosine(34) reductase QueG [Opitutaceae bacterium]|jgi:epoxyqueuosine reductase|nr:tRNA epoxyqueuosine(34) reductase QueG [Opitutaceae bacterium]
METRRELLRARLLALGFDDVRFARADDIPGSRLRAWIAAGHHADMHWMERTEDKRISPGLVLPDVATVIMLGINYWPGESGAGFFRQSPMPRSKVSKSESRKSPPRAPRASLEEREAQTRLLTFRPSTFDCCAAGVPPAESNEECRMKNAECPEPAVEASSSFFILHSSFSISPARGAAPPPPLSPSDSPSAAPVWARYALYSDYHDTVKPGLQAAGQVIEKLFGVGPHDYRYYVDAGPVLERAWAARAALGFQGKNAMLISREFGNWLFLAGILARIDIEPDPPLTRAAATREEPGLLCGKCTRCLDACPTQAFAAPGVVDARRCISYQTIENRGIIPRDLRAGIGNRIYGCDICAEVCPWNRFAQASRSLLLTPRPELRELALIEILELTPEKFATLFRKTAIKRVKLAGLLRNACIVAGNTRARECGDALIRLATPGGESGPPAVVRVHAVWALARLGELARLAAARAAETDPLVLAGYAAETA